MADLEPGTPEYQQAYDEEMAKLEAESPPKGEETTTEAVIETTETTEAKADDVKEPEKPSVEDEIKALKEALAKQEKIAKDNHAYATKKAQEYAKLQRKIEKEEREALRPELLDAVPGLEDAIRYTSPAREAEPWDVTVGRALPDIDGLLANEDFRKRVEAARSAVGEEWQDPVIAIRELSNVRTEYLREQTISSVREAARKDFESRSKKLSAMGVPGGSGKPAAPAADDGSKWATMSSEEFAKEKAKIRGY